MRLNAASPGDKSQPPTHIALTAGTIAQAREFHAEQPLNPRA
jgi:hypothetical protein